MASSLMRALEERAEQARADGLDPLVVLDLDGTLYDNTPRVLRILQEFGHQHASELPEAARRIDQLSKRDIAYRVGHTLRGVGIEDEELIARVERFWKKRFFTNDYVIHDLPMPGAVEFVTRLHASGLVPVYLTGRDAPNMLIGTIRTLQRDGFPVGRVDTRTILKDDPATHDEPYKRSVIEHLRATGRVVGVFDNEPGICNLFHEAFPDAVTVWLDTRYAPDPPARAEAVHRLEDFRELAD